MAIRWSSTSLADLDRIWDFNAARDPDRADRIERRIQDRALRIGERPLANRAGANETRESLVRDLQYVLIYTVEDDGVRIVRVLSTREKA